MTVRNDVPATNPVESLGSVNLSDHRQDVHKTRIVRTDLHRFRTADRFLPRLMAGTRTLEIGGGAGEMSKRLVERGTSLTFTDLSDANVERARALGATAHKLDLNFGLPGIPAESFDWIVMLEVIEHVVAAEFLLSEVYRVMKPGGSFLISTPNFVYWRNRMRVLLGMLSCDEGYHYRFFTPKVLEQRLVAAGLIPEKSAHSAPAVGLNFFVNRVFGKRRIHLPVPRPVAALMAHTLFVHAKKPLR